MSYRSLLVHVGSDPDHMARLQCAARLADDFEAAVIGLGAEAIAPLGIAAGGGYDAGEAAWLEAQREQIAARLRAAEATFRRTVVGRPGEWRTSWSAPTDAMACAARGGDLILAGVEPHRDPDRMVDRARLIVTAGRPVLCCPKGGERLSPRSALVAWKDTRESRRALADAVPLLKRAAEVVVLEVCAEDDAGCATARTLDVVNALGRHGVVARSRAAARKGSTAETILAEADAMGAALLVAGGYGHSRLGEWVFGGVTRALLDQDRRFVLFSH